MPNSDYGMGNPNPHSPAGQAWECAPDYDSGPSAPTVTEPYFLDGYRARPGQNVEVNEALLVAATTSALHDEAQSALVTAELLRVWDDITPGARVTIMRRAHGGGATWRRFLQRTDPFNIHAD